MRPVLALPLGAFLAASMGGWGEPHNEDVEGVASAFYDAYQAKDGAEACGHLAPKTKSELEQSAGKPCPRAILEENVPSVAEAPDIAVFGTQAEVTWDGETTFLARFQPTSLKPPVDVDRASSAPGRLWLR